MKIERTIKLDLAKQDSPIQLGLLASAGDSSCRRLIFEIFADGKPWNVPEDVRPYLAFQTDAGCSGQYDTLPTADTAVEVEENRVTVTLIDQVIAREGRVWLFLMLQDGNLNRVSSFYMTFDVERGFEVSGDFRQHYYRVSTLGQINTILEQILTQLDEVNLERNLLAAREAKAAADRAEEAAESVDAERIQEQLREKGDDLCVEDGRLYLTSGEKIIGEGTLLPDAAGGLAFDSGYVDADKLLHLTLNGADIEGFTPFAIPAGGSGSSSVMKLTTSLASRDFSILDWDPVCEIPFSWSSEMDGEATGSGFAEWTVNGSRAALVAVEQGDSCFDVRPYLSVGAENSILLKVTDIYGTFRTLSFAVSVTAFGLSWNLAETAVYGDDAVTVRLTPTGAGEKVLKLSLDGEVISETTVTATGRATTVVVPVQSHGAHTLKAWVEADVGAETLTTEPLVHTAIWLRSGYDLAVAAVLTPELTVSQYGTARIRWFAAAPGSETTSVVLRDGKETISTLHGVDRSVQTWSYKPTEAGEQELFIFCGNMAADVLLTVTELGYELNPVTAGLELDLDPAGHSNSEADRTSFGYADADGVSHPLIFSDNFDWTNGGFRMDDEGVTAFVVRRGCYVTLDRGFFDSDCRAAGRHVKLIFKSENVRSYDAELMRCKSGNVGMVIQAQKATVCSQLETMTVPYFEGQKIEMDLCIGSENEDALAWIDLKGIQSCPPVMYGSTDSWAQSSPVPLTIGSKDADVWIYRMKLWGNSLNRYERLDEHICCAGTTEEMAARHNRNDIYNTDGSISLSKLAKANPELRVIHIKADRMTTGKEDEVVCDMEIIYEAGGEKHHLIIQNAVIKAQGTSSLEYILAALNLDADLAAEGCVVTNGLGESVTEYAMTDHSISVSYFNLKANVASSESANNVILADEYNRWNPYICAPKAADSRVRDTVEGHPCAVFFTSTAEASINVGARTVQPGETILYFVGDMNNSKKNFAVFGQDNARWLKQCCVEVMNNTELPCRFREEISDGETWKDGNFEFRFPKNPTDEMKQAFMAMQLWVVSTDRDAATCAALEAPASYDGILYTEDTAEYRAAKFRGEFADYFVPEAMDFHYLFTDCSCMTDNRAKNLFFCYEYVEDLEDYRWSVRCDYDNDTGLGNDNSGGLTFGYGLEDTDMAGDSWVFNAHDSVLWCNIRDLRSGELASLHARLAGQGAWDPQRRTEKFRDYQSAVCEALRAEDMHNKYFLPWLLKDGAAYAKKCYGTKEYQREQFLHYQTPYKAGQYIDISNRSDAISMRATIETADAGDLTLTGYSDMYFVVMYGNGGTVKVRAQRNTPTRIECPTDSLGDTETYIFGASNLTAISSLAGLKPKFVLATTARRLQELIVGSGEVGYQNLNLNQIGVGGNQMLRLLDLRGCPNLVTALDLTALTSLERFLANGSGITGVSFAKGAPLTEIRLPAVSSLVALELKHIETFLMDSSALALLRVEDCEGIDTCAICAGAPLLERGRLTNVDWDTENASVLLGLTGLGGFDAQGKLTDRFVLTGKAHVAAATQLEIDAITASFPELELTVDSIVPSYSVTFCNHDGTLLHSQTIREGGYAADPVRNGSCAVPTKKSDVEYHYTYAGWDKHLGPITGDTVITAVFTASDRYYQVRWWSDPSESALLQEAAVIAHGTAAYSGSDPTGNGLWAGWDKEAENVVSDLEIHPVFYVPELPDHMPEDFDYLWSNDPDAESALTAEQFLGILVNGAARDWFRLGDRIRIKCDTENFVDSEIILELRSYRHFRSAENAGEWAGPYFGMVGLMNATRRMNETNTNVGGFPEMEAFDFLNEVVYTGLPHAFRAMIEKIEVLSSAGNTSAQIVSADTYLTLESHAEIGFHADAVPYINEVAEGADEITFACYTDDASRVKKTYNGQGSADGYWMRSPSASDSAHYGGIDAGGRKSDLLPLLARGISFGFCLRGSLPGGEG